jgi:peroxiredoxin
VVLTREPASTRIPGMIPLRWGQAAPDFELPSTEGRPIALREFRGRDVVLGFYCYDFGGI